MAGQSQSSSLNTSRLQTLQPNFRVSVAIGFALVCVTLVAMGYIRGGVPGAALAGLGLLAAIFLAIHYRKERILANSHQTATGVVKEYTMRGKYNPHLWGGMPHIKYSFVAFDQKLYEGQAGWNVQDLREGTRIAVFYDPTNPRLNLPVVGFIFYSFGSTG